MCVGGEGVRFVPILLLAFIVGVINTSEHFETKAKVTNIEAC